MRELGDLLAGIVDERLIAPHRARLVAGLFDDSRCVQPHGLFVAVRGTTVDGRAYVHEAVARGATVVVGEELPANEKAVMLSVPDGRLALARLALRWHRLDGDSDLPFKLVGITGTNGKTTTAIMTRAILAAAGQECGLLGTVGHDLCGRSVPAHTTTPGALELAGHLRACADAGAKFVVMEVSSHALDQQRVAGLRFAATAFTNLSGDHLDYHGTLERYRAVKARLFAGLDPQATAVVNRDDPSSAAVVQGCRARQVWYSLNAPVDVYGAISRQTLRATSYRISLAGRELLLEHPLPGRHNVYNALAAAGLAQALGLPPAAIETGLQAVRGIPGRLQRVSCASPADVFVDYAHTDDALHNALQAIKPLVRGRLIVVFGCGGDRDRTKRPRMGRVAAQLADTLVVTSDNPRSEDPRAIIAEIVSGLDTQARQAALVEPERAAAIRAALEMAAATDVVLIAGKGHEDYQIIGDRRIHFDDVEVAQQAAAELSNAHSGDW